jgi:SAM-dependent methyltransferase
MPTAIPAAGPNAAQIEHWNEVVSGSWIAFQDKLDRQLGRLGLRAMEALALRPGESVLDIGCGCGATTIELAGAVGAGGCVLGVDVSEPMLAVARRRAGEGGFGNVSFETTDAQTEVFEEGAFDAAFSRFGVMFFADPAAAFGNVRLALKPGGRLAFVCWQGLAGNLWMKVPLDAAIGLFEPLPPVDPLAPGPFAFADPQRVRVILADAGFGDIAVASYERPIGGGTLDEVVTLSLNLGPLGALLREHPDRRDAAAAAVRAALAPYDGPDGVLVPSATWIVTARAPERHIERAPH